MKKIHFLLSILLMLLFNISYSQKDYKPGYVITNNNDTLFGLINLKSNSNNSKKCEFKVKNDQSHKVFSPDEIKAYKIESSKYYVSRVIAINNVKQKVFLEYLVHGIVDLYYLKDLDNEHFFIKKDSLMMPLSNEEKTIVNQNNEQFSQNSNQYIGALTFLFKESPALTNKINNTPFIYNSLISITKDYHNSVCKDKACIDYTVSNKTSITIEPFVGMINSSMSIKGSSDHAHNTKPYIGFNLKLNSSKNSHLLNIWLGLNYSTNNFTGVFKSPLFDYNQFGFSTFVINTNYNILRLPITIEYTIPVKKIQPFLSLSFSNILLFNRNYSVTTYYYDRISDYYAMPYGAEFRFYQFGLSAGIGARYILKNTSYIFLKNEIEFRKCAAAGEILNSHHVTSWLINFGYGFKLK